MRRIYFAVGMFFLALFLTAAVVGRWSHLDDLAKAKSKEKSPPSAPIPDKPNPGWYVLSDTKFVVMKKTGIPETVIAKLRPLKNKWGSQEHFIGEINNVLTEAEQTQFRTTIVELAFDRPYWMEPTLHELGLKMGYTPELARQGAFQFMKSHDPRISMLRRVATALGVGVKELMD